MLVDLFNSILFPHYNSKTSKTIIHSVELMKACIYLKRLPKFKDLTILEIYQVFYIWKCTTSIIRRRRSSTQTYLILLFCLFVKTCNVMYMYTVRNINHQFDGKLIKVSVYNMPLDKEKLYSTLVRFFKGYKINRTEKWTQYFVDKWEKKNYIYNKLKFLKKLNVFNFLILHKFTTTNTVIINKNLIKAPYYSSSSINKYIPFTNDFEFQFLRKNKVYNKGRYSRCRQNYRTGVYMCMYLSILSLFGLYYWFYKFSFNFTYLWWFFISFIASFFIPKILKYRLYNPKVLFLKICELINWVKLFIESL